MDHHVAILSSLVFVLLLILDHQLHCLVTQEELLKWRLLILVALETVAVDSGISML
jgi:hypothetical protein